MKEAAIAFMLPTVALAGWGTNMWPAYQFPRSGTARGMECYSGLVERCKAVGIDPATINAPVWYRSQRGDLAGFKADVKTLLEKTWLDSGACPITNATGWLTANVPPDIYGWSGRTAPRLTLLAICSNANLPTNFFDYTPYRCLSGLGPFTNDATVGHPYGYTGTETAAGGTFFPAGRTNWYTTDYGWDGMTGAVSQLVASFDRLHYADTYAGAGTTVQENIYFNPDGVTRRGSSYSGYPWADVKATLETWTNTALDSIPPQAYTMGYQDASNSPILGAFQKTEGDIAVFHYATNISRTTYAYVACTTNPTTVLGAPTNISAVFDANDSGLIQGWQALANWGPETSLVYTQAVGTGTVSVFPAWCDEPPNSNQVKNVKGWFSFDAFSATEWDFTFK